MSDTNKLVYFRHLPHIQSVLHPLFITWRLKFTLPVKITHSLIVQKQESDAKLATLSPDYVLMQRHVNEKKRFEWLDSQILSIPDTPDFLKHKDIAQIVMDTLIFHNGVRYILYAYCIMPNHVHVIIQQNAEEDGNPYPLPKITQSWKRHSSTQIKRVLNRSEPVWQDESYDHVIRNEQELSYYLEYTIMNPVHAGLAVKWEDWGFTWINPVFL